MKNLTILLIVMILCSCVSKSTKEQVSPEESITTEEPVSTGAQVSSETPETVPENPIIELEITIKSEDLVNFVITTNIPLPIECMMSISLQDQAPDDIYIGASQRIKIERSPYSYDFDITDYKLPSGNYDAEVSFYPRWGAENGNPLAKQITKEVKGSKFITIGTPHGSVQKREAMDKKQSWVLNNVVMDTPWNKDEFIKQLGECEELKVTKRNPDIIKAFYFPDADMTIIINQPKKVVVTYSIGKDTDL